MSAEEVLPLEHLQVLRLEPGDVLVLTLPVELTQNHADRLRDQMAAQFPDHKCLIIDSGGSMGVIRSEP